MTDKTLKTARLRRLNKTQLYKQEENRKKQPRRYKQEERRSSKEEVKRIKERSSKEAKTLRQGGPKLNKSRRAESRRMRYTSTRLKLDRKVS